VAVTVVSTEDVQLGYVPPPGVVDQADRRDAGLQIGSQQINEKSLRLVARGMDAGERAEAYLRFTTEGDKNFLRYRTLRAWARGRGPGWDDGDLEFYIKAGKNEHNFYLYRTPARTVAWEPEVVVQLDRWLVLRTQIEQAWLAGAPPQVFPGCPDSTFLPPADSAYVRCDGPYVAYVRNPGTAPPNLAQVQELAVGMVRVSQDVFVDVAELWVDDIRLADVVDDVGLAGALDISLSAANVADLSLSLTRRDGQFRQLGEDPSYVTSDALSVGGTIRLERFLPAAWGLAAPVTARVVRRPPTRSI
jgi:cell surface protein SprA